MTQKYTRRVAVNMVIANMIGTGIFTSLGFQVLDSGIPDPFAIMMIWLVGGVIALCGATVYGEVATTVNRSGGEYAFLSEIYHPLLGFISGWISMIIGFSAAIAALSIAAGEYFSPVLGLEKDAFWNIGGLHFPIVKLIATLIIVLVVFVHVNGVKFGGVFQNYMTYLKLILIAAFLVIPFLFLGKYEASGISYAPDEDSWSTIFSLPFAGSLVWVMFAYSGWNASTYIVGNLENPRKNLPYSLIAGTLVVTLIYMLLNFVFMYVATFDELALQVDLGNVVAVKILGEKYGLIFSLVFSIALISGVSAMFIAGPRVVQEVGKDYSMFAKLGKQSASGAPKTALLLLMIISVSLVYLLNFQDLIEYIGVTLSIFSLLTVVSVFVLRYRKRLNENTVRSWGFPLTPLVFSAFTIWMIWYFVQIKPIVLVWFLLTILPAILLYFISKNARN